MSSAARAMRATRLATRDGAMVRRCDGATVRRCDGATVRRCDGATVRRCDGATVRRCDGASTASGYATRPRAPGGHWGRLQMRRRSRLLPVAAARSAMLRPAKCCASIDLSCRPYVFGAGAIGQTPRRRAVPLSKGEGVPEETPRLAACALFCGFLVVFPLRTLDVILAAQSERPTSRRDSSP
jgi:hypothetical protein